MLQHDSCHGARRSLPQLILEPCARQCGKPVLLLLTQSCAATHVCGRLCDGLELDSCCVADCQCLWPRVKGTWALPATAAGHHGLDCWARPNGKSTGREHAIFSATGHRARTVLYATATTMPYLRTDVGCAWFWHVQLSKFNRHLGHRQYAASNAGLGHCGVCSSARAAAVVA
jgi:hypothetical protein